MTLGRLRRVGLVIALSVVASFTAKVTFGREGVVYLDNRALADAGGPFNALGASLFWALWGERHDAARLDANLAFLAGHGVDFVRVFGMVGAESWADRRIDPRAPDYWSVVDRFLARLARHGLRVEVTIFADAQVMMPDSDERRRFAEAWAARAEREAARFVFVEISNEHWQNGLDDVAELRELGQRVADRTRVLVALSATLSGQTCEVYAGSAADLATVHYSRNESAPWRLVLLPWQWPGGYDERCGGTLPVAVNNEPVGPGSSVSGENDPARLIMAYVTTFVSQNAAYVLHAGAGVRGGGAADVAMGRAANFFGPSASTATLEGIRRVRAYLPAGLANWDRHAPGDRSHPFAGFDVAVDRGALAGAPATTSGDRFVVAPSGLREPVAVRSRRACLIEVHDPLEPGVVGIHDLAAGESLTIEGRESFVLTGACAGPPVDL